MPPSTMGPSCCSGTARRTSPPPTSSSPRRSATMSPTPPRTSSRPTSRPTAPSWPGWSPPSPAGSPTSRRRGRPTPTPSGSSSSPPSWRCWPRCRSDQPVVLVLDDLQWADKGSLLLLRHLAVGDRAACGSSSSAPIRDNELSQSHPLLDTLAALHRQDGVSRIELAGLDDTGVRRPHGGGRRSRPSTTPRSASPTPSTGRPTATRSSSARSCATSPRPAPSTGTTPAVGGRARPRSG